MTDSPGLIVIAEYRLRPESRDTVLETLPAMVASSREEEGNLRYDALLDSVDPDRVVIVEAYRSEADFEVHRTSAHFTEHLVNKVIPLLASRTVTTYAVAHD